MVANDREDSPQPPENLVANGEQADSRTNRRPWWWRRLVDLAVDTTPERRREIMDELLPEGKALRNYIYRFIILQSLSVLIALFGLLSDSAAVVIGAMLVAPLMRPVLGVAASLVTGRPIRRGASFVIVMAASAGSIFLAWAVTELLPLQFIDELPEEMLARTAPTLLDLGIALAAGAAGAYALVRREVSDALPGVAVAVALVPPLTTVGATFALGEPGLAAGALLLYLTNLTAIVLIGTLVFILTGFAPRGQMIRDERRIRQRVVTAAIAVVIISAPLALHTLSELIDQQDTYEAHEEMERWLRGTGLEVTDLEVSFEASLTDTDNVRTLVDADVAGPEKPPPVNPLARDLAQKFGDNVTVSVRWTKREETSARANPWRTHSAPESRSAFPPTYLMAPGGNEER